jgi:hypothetical protein
VKTDRWVASASQPRAKGENIDWAQAYEKRMLRYNLEVVLVALIALIVAIASFVFSL